MDPVAVSGCTCSCSTWQRSVKRKLPEASAGAAAAAAARVDLGNEAAALREVLSSQQQTIQELCAELEQEQSAASSAASEAMSMILRLQREKAEVQMESRQFRRFADERMAHDQRELAELDEVLFRRDQAVRSLSCEVRAYRHRLASYGIEDDLAIGSAAMEPDAGAGIVSPLPVTTEFNLPEYGYPPLRCTLRSGDYWDDENVDLDKHLPTPTLHKLLCLESRICELETAPRDEELNTNALDGHDEHGEVGDDGSGRVDTVHGMPTAGVSDEDEGSCYKVEVDGNDVGEDVDVNKLYRRLQALEADRESMRQAIISMRTEKAQLVLLKEIAQELCKEVAPERRVVKKPSLLKTFLIVTVFKVFLWSIEEQCWFIASFRQVVSCQQVEVSQNLSKMTAAAYNMLTRPIRFRHEDLIVLLCLKTFFYRVWMFFYFLFLFLFEISVEGNIRYLRIQKREILLLEAWSLASGMHVLYPLVKCKVNK